jgi:CheY-like chemotaxis protein
MVCFQRYPEDAQTGTTSPSHTGGRLNLLLSSGWRRGGPADQLPQLLDSLGIYCLHARTGQEATRLVESTRVDIALIDLELPMDDTNDTQPAGPRILQLLRRLDPAPPTVVIRPAQSTKRDDSRGLSDALREGAFAVLDRPLNLESMLETLRRVVRRHYSDRWPAA